MKWFSSADGDVFTSNPAAISVSNQEEGTGGSGQFSDSDVSSFDGIVPHFALHKTLNLRQIGNHATGMAGFAD
jgi:hypothetical protein